jgi:hypothetical protein
MHNTTVSDAMVEAAIDAWENVYEAELQLGSLAYTDNKEVAMRAAIDAALAPSVVKPCEVKALLKDVLAYLEGGYPNVTSGGQRNADLRSRILATLSPQGQSPAKGEREGGGDA